MLKANSYLQSSKVKWEILPMSPIIKDHEWVLDTLEIMNRFITTISWSNLGSRSCLLKTTSESLWTIWMWTRISQVHRNKRRTIQDWRPGSCLSQLSSVRIKRDRVRFISKKTPSLIKIPAQMLGLLHTWVWNATHSQSISWKAHIMAVKPLFRAWVLFQTFRWEIVNQRAPWILTTRFAAFRILTWSSPSAQMTSIMKSWITWIWNPWTKRVCSFFSKELKEVITRHIIRDSSNCNRTNKKAELIIESKIYNSKLKM